MVTKKPFERFPAHPCVDDSATKVKDLTGRHIGAIVRFEWEFPNRVYALVRGHLREIRHDARGTTLLMAGIESDTGEHQHFEELNHATPVTVESLF